MADILQTIFQINSIDFLLAYLDGLSPNMCQTIFYTNDNPAHRQ